MVSYHEKEVYFAFLAIMLTMSIFYFTFPKSQIQNIRASPSVLANGCIKLCGSPSDSRDDLQYIACTKQLGGNVCSGSCTGTYNENAGVLEGQIASPEAKCSWVDCSCSQP